MATSQWFLQWNLPAVVVADVGRNFDKIAIPEVPPNTKTILDYSIVHQNDSFQSPGRQKWKVNEDKRIFNYLDEKKKFYDPLTLTGLTLWLTVLNAAASPQEIVRDADADTLPFRTLYKWKSIDFDFPNSMYRRMFMITKKFIPENVVPLGIEVFGARAWITMPRWRAGVPATLATVPINFNYRHKSPVLSPYPDWNFHRGFHENDRPKCMSLVSVFRLSVDQCGRLWVLDSGQINSQNEPKQICPPALFVFDITTDKFIARYEIPKKFVLENSLFSNLVIDTRDNFCSNLHVYIADTWRFGLVVFRERDASFWRFSHQFFYPDPFSSNFTLHGLNFQWTDGILGLALTPADVYDDRLLLFHPMSSKNEFYVPTSILRSPESVSSGSNFFKSVGESRGENGQSSGSGIDKNGVMFYGLVSRDGVGCWDTRKPYTKRNQGMVVSNEEKMMFPNDLKIDHQKRQSVWIITNRLPQYQAKRLDFDDFNYRILYADVMESIRDTVCDPYVGQQNTLQPTNIP